MTLADHVIVVNKEWGGPAEEEFMADCNTVVTVQTIHRLFPSIHFITELAHSSNMRFMQFNAKDLYALHQSQFEKVPPFLLLQVHTPSSGAGPVRKSGGEAPTSPTCSASPSPPATSSPPTCWTPSSTKSLSLSSIPPCHDLDTGGCQAMVKDYLIQFVRLLLGIDQALGSGYLDSASTALLCDGGE